MGYFFFFVTEKRMISSATLEATVAIAAPLTPSAGKPNKPKIKIAFSIRFTKSETSVAPTATLTFSIERRVIIKIKFTAKGKKQNAETLR